ncbi:MAG: hypothetical protein O7C75_12140 [Verrucomicrobia bacterium]|nr:hypothetical protein [Verrucomicrobiota bacterium]
MLPLLQSDRILWFFWAERKGPSEFPYDQRALLSESGLESLVESKRVNSEVMVFKVSELIALQQEILDLIDEELEGAKTH